MIPVLAAKQDSESGLLFPSDFNKLTNCGGERRTQQCALLEGHFITSPSPTRHTDLIEGPRSMARIDRHVLATHG
ncbi:hypothetical protein VTO73DRAFT_12364 [Trametes versicolor]